jgi:gluconokinase
MALIGCQVPRAGAIFDGSSIQFSAVLQWPMVLILFGVAGAGKTTTGRLLAAKLGWDFYDADDLHSAANIEKMRALFPLSDSDRTPWLEKIRALIENCIVSERNAVLACSALKESYRRYLTIDPERVKWVYLKGDPALLRERLKNRHGHFMNPGLLESQFATLEEPQNTAIAIEVDQSPALIVDRIRSALNV